MPEQKILLTGVNGFVGHHVARELHMRGFKILGASNQPTLSNSLGHIVDNYICCDLSSPSEVKKIDLSDIKAIINLAGFASISRLGEQGDLYVSVNVGVHTALYNECLRQNVAPRIVAVSTGAVYESNQKMPITETSKLVDDDKTNKYVVSKKRMEEAVQEFCDKGLDCIIARPFNHTGPGQLAGFIVPDLASELLEAKKAGRPLKVGNLNTKRDYTDVRDVARAYVLLATEDRTRLKHKTYNICSGESKSGEEILDLLCSAYGLRDVEYKIDSSRLRQNEVMDLYGSYKNLRQDLGWEPEIKMPETIQDFVAWHKKQ